MQINFDIDKGLHYPFNSVDFSALEHNVIYAVRHDINWKHKNAEPISLNVKFKNNDDTTEFSIEIFDSFSNKWYAYGKYDQSRKIILITSNVRSLFDKVNVLNNCLNDHTDFFDKLYELILDLISIRNY